MTFFREAVSALQEVTSGQFSHLSLHTPRLFVHLFIYKSIDIHYVPGTAPGPGCAAKNQTKFHRELLRRTDDKQT